MTIDRYTKAVLTVIAACLVWQCALTLGGAVHAQQMQPPGPSMTGRTATPVVIVGWGEMNPSGEIVRLSTKKSGDSYVTDPILPVRPASNGAPLPVSVTTPVRIESNPRMPVSVDITAIRNTGVAWDPITARVEPNPAQSRPGIPKERR
jgi:hypothetical protein